MEDLTGKQFGPYRVVAPLGEGGMAAVYRAYQASVDRFVALKVLPRYFASDPQFVGRFQQEARTLAKLQHPRILAVHDFGESDGYTYIVMPFVDSGTLADLMEGEPLPLQEIANMVGQIASALDYAHGMGVIHRDVKPSNVLVDGRGNCLLTDFGIAKMVEGTSQFTRTGGTVGTPTYMSPEQIQGETLDGRSDVYSLGIMLYEMATGRPPFRAETPPAIFVKHLHDPLPPPHLYNADIPEDVERVILKALAKQPSHRFQTAGEMAAALVRAVAGQPVELAGVAAPKRMSSTEAAPLQARAKRRPAWLWGLLAVALLAVVATAVLIVLNLLPEGNKPEQVVAQPTATARPTDRPAIEAPTRAATQPPTAAPTATPRPTPTPVPPPRTVLDPWGEVLVPAGERPRLAFVGALSGDLAQLGEAELNGFRLAMEDAGSLLGFELDPDAMLILDGGCAEDGGPAAEVVAAGDIVGVIGHTCTVSCIAAAPVYESAHMVTISPSCSGPKLTESGWQTFNRVIVRDDRGSADFEAALKRSAGLQEFVRRYQERFAVELPVDLAPAAGYSYDATRLLLERIAQVAEVDDSGRLIVGRRALAEQVRGDAVHAGVTGEFAIDEQGDRLIPMAAGACQPGDLRVGLVVDISGINDGGFNQGVWEGLQGADRELSVCAHYLESQSPDDYETDLERMAQEGHDLIVVMGFPLAEAASQVAARYPAIRFVMVDAQPDRPRDNVHSVVFQVNEASFLAGYLAAAWAAEQDPADPQVGFLGGMRIPSVELFEVGYAAGVARYNRERTASVGLVVEYADSFVDPGIGEMMGLAMLDGGVDVLFPAGGLMGNGALVAARDRGRWAIGVDLDQYNTIPGARPALLTSVLKRVDTAVYALIEALLAGELPPGESYTGRLSNQGVGLAPFHEYEDRIPADLRQALETLGAGIEAGQIKTGE